MRNSHRIGRHEATDDDAAAVMHVPHHRLTDRIAAIADYRALRHGHRTSYDFREGAYWVPIEGQWMAVPDRAVIRDHGNPVGEAVVWYVRHRGSIIISCFVPADAV